MPVKFFTNRRRRKYAGGSRGFLPALRAASMRKLFADRHGPTLPDDDIGRDRVWLMATMLCWLKRPRERIWEFITTSAPWMPDYEAEDIIDNVLTKPRRWTADKLGARLSLTSAERARLCITTIGAVDLPKAVRLELRKEYQRAASEARRRVKGIKKRITNGPPLTKTRPWDRAHISRASWYRRRQSEKPNHPRS